LACDELYAATDAEQRVLNRPKLMSLMARYFGSGAPLSCST
jgi:hypothetical protein